MSIAFSHIHPRSMAANSSKGKSDPSSDDDEVKKIEVHGAAAEPAVEGKPKDPDAAASSAGVATATPSPKKSVRRLQLLILRFCMSPARRNPRTARQ